LILGWPKICIAPNGLESSLHLIPWLDHDF
jgi:hypothetical protein